MLNLMPTTNTGHRSISVSNPALQTKIRVLGGGLFAFLLPFFFITLNVSYITNSEWLYTYGWWRNDIAGRSGLTEHELNRGADQIKEYFSNDAELLDVRVVLNGNEVSLYNKREVLHMVDVKELMQGVFSLARVTGGSILLLTVIGILPLRRYSASLAFEAVGWSAAGTGALLFVFAVAAIIDFGWLFTQFHFLSFTNDLWQLDPYQDYLLIMFPQQFFFDATLFIGLLTLLDFALAYLLAGYAKKRFWERP